MASLLESSLEYRLSSSVLYTDKLLFTEISIGIIDFPSTHFTIGTLALVIRLISFIPSSLSIRAIFLAPFWGPHHQIPNTDQCLQMRGSIPIQKNQMKIV